MSELIELLSELDPDAEVYMISQRNYPFEVALDGLTVREGFAECADDPAPRMAIEAALQTRKAAGPPA